IVMLTTTSSLAQMAVAQPVVETDNAISTNRFVGIMGGMYGYAYPAGSIYTSDNYVKREKGKYFGATQAIGYELWPHFILHGGFTLWDMEVFITRHLLMQDMKQRYSLDTCALHTGLLFVYKWFFADAIVYTELPLEKDTERVELNGVYMQTNTLKRQYENGGFLGMGVRVPVLEWLDVLIGLYGGGSFVPAIVTTKHDELYVLNGALRIGVIVYFPNQEKKL
ncbi:MAG: hypothetical protein QHH74_14880, partial [Spirochaetota bacterium]|nr:hypothetical protein [Spirochaetota bacterium]